MLGNCAVLCYCLVFTALSVMISTVFQYMDLMVFLLLFACLVKDKCSPCSYVNAAMQEVCLFSYSMFSPLLPI